MRFAFTFFFVGITIAHASMAKDYAQTVTFSMNMNNRTVEEVLNEIEESSEFVFFYHDGVFDLNRQVSVKVKNQNFDKVFNKLFEGTDNEYVIDGRQIFIVKKNEQLQQQPIQNKTKRVTGKVFDETGDPLPGASILVKGTLQGVTTDVNGLFQIDVVQTDVLVISFLGYEKIEIPIDDQTIINVQMTLQRAELDEVVVTGWGREKKTSLVGAVSTIRPKELKGPTSNITTMLAGRVAGLISYQLSGEPGRDNAEFFVRGVGTFEGIGRSSAPLILINGIESTSSELAKIQPDDIESFSVLKDATTTSMYGTRGANGVLLINTKRGVIGKTKFNVRYENSISSNAKDYNMADNITYMTLANEATLTRDVLGTALRPYSTQKIDATRTGKNSLIYPNNNWREIMIKDYTMNHRFNLNVSGGAEQAQYYLSMSYKEDNGILKEHELNDFDTNVKSRTVEVRSNIDLTLTKTTMAAFRVTGLFSDLNGPSVGTGGAVFQSMLRANPVMFPAVYPQNYKPWSKHPLYGNASRSQSVTTSADYYNPFASALSGYSEDKTTAWTVQFEANQDFAFLLPGMKGRLMAYTRRNTASLMSRSVIPYYYQIILDPEQIDIITGLTSLNEGREYLSYSESGKEMWNENWLEMAFNYDQMFNGVHAITSSLIGYMREKQLSNAGSLERSLPQRNLSFSGRITYGFCNRYLAELNFGYNASERFASHNRWGFFPSAGLAWNVAEENFGQSMRDWLDKLKIRLSYGIVGNDNLTDWINYSGIRYFFMERMNIPSGNTIFLGTDAWKGYKTISVAQYANPGITWEKSYKKNLAFEIGLFKSLDIELDFFQNHTNNILMARSDLPTTMGLASSSPIYANIGELTSRGGEITVNYNKAINKNSWVLVRGTATYATNKTMAYEEPDYPDELKHLSILGYNWNMSSGLIAERLFIDDEEVANSPRQTFSSNYMAGDIKYYDVNRDGLIDNNDRVKMGYPTTPEFVYGAGFSLGYKDFDFSAFFQGQMRTSFMISASNIMPFYDHQNGCVNGLLQVIAEDHWSETNRNPYAFYPRLSIEQVANNNQPSSWWLRDGSFLRFKTIELGYEPKGKWVKKTIGIESFRIYVSGMNLFTWSKFKLWDVEMKGNGFGYPLQRVFNFGIQISL